MRASGTATHTRRRSDRGAYVCLASMPGLAYAPPRAVAVPCAADDVPDRVRGDVAPLPRLSPSAERVGPNKLACARQHVEAMAHQRQLCRTRLPTPSASARSRGVKSGPALTAMCWIGLSKGACSKARASAPIREMRATRAVQVTARLRGFPVLDLVAAAQEAAQGLQ